MHIILKTDSNTKTYKQIHIPTYTKTHTDNNTITQTIKHTQTHRQIYIYIYIYIYININIYIYIYIYIPRNKHKPIAKKKNTHKDTYRDKVTKSTDTNPNKHKDMTI